MQIVTLTAEGSDRATAYHMSNKIIRRPEGLYVTWLDGDYRCVLARVHAGSGRVEVAFALAQGFDNHCGAALAQAPDGTLHFIAGSHHHAFIHRYSTTPDDPHSWSLPQAVGYGATYPSLLCDSAGTLHLAHRSHTEPHWSAHYLRRPHGEAWSGWRQLIEAPAPGYTYPTNALALGPDGTLHAVIEFYKTYRGNAAPPHAMAVAHLESPDGGGTWFHTDGRPVASLPVCLEDTTPVRYQGGGNLRPGNGIVLPDGQPAIAIWDMSTATLELAVRQPDRAWRRYDLTAALVEARPGYVVNSQGHLGVGKDGSVIVVASLAPERKWGHSASELHILRVDPRDGQPLRHTAIPKVEPDEPDWLPSVEQGHPRDDDPYLLYMTGNRGDGCVNKARCSVRLLKLG